MGTPPCFPLKQRSRKKENKASNNNTPSRDSLSGGGVGWALSQHAGDLLAHNKSGA